MRSDIELHNITSGGGARQQAKHEIVKLTDLKGNCAYFGFSDYYVIELAKKRLAFSTNEQQIYRDIERKLKIALLFFDKIIVHFADIIRSKELYTVFNEYRRFIEEGNIDFLYSSSITEINQTAITAYATKKHKDGEKGLELFINDHNFANEAINLLSCSKRIVHRGYLRPSKEQFIDIVQKDLEKSETAQKFISPRGILTLYQILFAIDKNENKLPPHLVNTFIDKIENIAAGDTYSRQHILEDFDKIIGEKCMPIYSNNTHSARRQNQIKPLAVPPLHRDSIEERLCLLYANLNANTHFIIDFHPEREKYLPFRISTLDTYLGKFTRGRITAIQQLTPHLIENIRNSVDYKRFIADYFLSYRQWRIRQDTDIVNNIREIQPVNYIEDYHQDFSNMLKGGV